jgi:nicotinamidase-related amidase
MDIAHPLWWEDASGNPPPPFTIITRQDVEAGRWQATRPEARARSQAYVAALEAGGRYPLCIWNPHCLMGSVGHTVYAPLFEALCAWEATTRIPVDYIHKGSNIWTEHYSAIQADVPDPDDPTTLPNHALITALREADVVFIAGEAGSHCVANTVRDLVQHLGEDYDLSRLMLLTDTLSPVTGFEALQETFLEEMSERGVRICTTETALAEWAKG